MSDLERRLAALHSTHHGAARPGAVPDDVVAGDLRRGRRARRRRRTIVVATGAVLAVAAGSIGYAAASGGDGHAPVAAHTPVTTSTRPTAASSTPASSAPESSKPASPTLELVAYRGDQLPGYTVTRIPKGYVLQGISGSVLDVAERGDHSSLDTFLGKLVVMLNDHPGVTTDTPVTVHGVRGYVDNQDGVQILYYDLHGRHVAVQAWSNIHITVAQLVEFANGVTVLPNAQEGHG